jgi:hypothetical protein
VRVEKWRKGRDMRMRREESSLFLRCRDRVAGGQEDVIVSWRREGTLVYDMSWTSYLIQ